MNCVQCHATTDPSELYCSNCRRAEIVADEAAKVAAIHGAGARLKAFGNQCDAITATGKRCKRLNHVFLPCMAVANAAIGQPRQTFRGVCLCRQHAALHDRKRETNDRLKLHHGGWLGAYNEYRYGNLVTTTSRINWKTAKRLIVPRFWAEVEGK